MKFFKIVGLLLAISCMSFELLFPMESPLTTRIMRTKSCPDLRGNLFKDDIEFNQDQGSETREALSFMMNRINACSEEQRRIGDDEKTTKALVISLSAEVKFLSKTVIELQQHTLIHQYVIGSLLQGKSIKAINKKLCKKNNHGEYDARSLEFSKIEPLPNPNDEPILKEKHDDIVDKYSII